MTLDCSISINRQLVWKLLQHTPWSLDRRSYFPEKPSTGPNIIKNKMANLTEKLNHTTIQEWSCATRHYGIDEKIFIVALNILLSTTAFLGNILIVAALQKVSTSLHLPSRLLFRCLAVTDLCVGLTAQPLLVSYLMSADNSKRCYYLRILFYTIGGYFSALSCLKLSAISMDRLLALLFGPRYGQIVTLKRARVVVMICWFCCGSVVVVFIYNEHIAQAFTSLILLLCVVTSTFCYTKIYLTLRHQQNQVQDLVHQEQTKQGSLPLNVARYKKTVSSALWLQMTFVACYLPFGIAVAIFAVTGLSTPSFDFAWDVSLSCLLLNSTLNPFLYCWKMKEVRQSVRNTIKDICCSWSWMKSDTESKKQFTIEPFFMDTSIIGQLYKLVCSHGKRNWDSEPLYSKVKNCIKM